MGADIRARRLDSIAVPRTTRGTCSGSRQTKCPAHPASGQLRQPDPPTRGNLCQSGAALQTSSDTGERRRVRRDSIATLRRPVAVMAHAASGEIRCRPCSRAGSRRSPRAPAAAPPPRRRAGGRPGAPVASSRTHARCRLASRARCRLPGCHRWRLNALRRRASWPRYAPARPARGSRRPATSGRRRGGRSSPARAGSRRPRS